MFIDEVDIVLKAGHGGAGKVSFYPGARAGPDGGNGGRGGDVYVRATTDLTALAQFSRKKLLEAPDGKMGGSNRKFGADGENLIVTLPIGTSLTDKTTGEEIILNHSDEELLICKGGIGGRGNFELKSSRRTTPKFAQKGLEGEEKHFKVNLKLIADFGLIGLPNAGKSSLLNELTSANVRVADYPFTTLEPNLGVLDGRIFADIPGLIEGASAGKGLGIKFLKHIEKVNILIHCVSSESDDPNGDYQTVRKELAEFSPALMKKKEIVLMTKSDLLDKEAVEKKMKLLKKLNPKTYPVSVHDWDSLEKLKMTLKV